MTACPDCRAKDACINDLARRLAAASAVLGRLAERDGRVAEIMRLRAALEEIAAGQDVTRIAWKAMWGR